MAIATARHALAAALSLALVAVPAAGQEIPDRPEALSFEPIVFDPPSAKDHRHVLDNGMVVFIAEDRSLPLVNIAITLRVGSWLDPVGQEGLASLTGSQMRRGGTKVLSGEELDERLDFLAAQVSTGIGATSGGANLNCLADNLEEALPLFVDVLRDPRFQEDRLVLARERALQSMKKRNDDSADIEAREWGVLLYGENHYSNRFTTEASLGAISRDHLVAFHRTYVHPSNMIAAVSGYFDTNEMLAQLEDAFARWPGEAPSVPAIPHTIEPARPGLYRIQKDVNQGRVSIGLPTVKRDYPDAHALQIMNGILGGSGFTSRITTTVRSNEGLAYSAGSGLSVGVWHPGRFRAGFQSKSPNRAVGRRAGAGRDPENPRSPRHGRGAGDDQEQPHPDLPVELLHEGAGHGHLRLGRVHGPEPVVLADLSLEYPRSERRRRPAGGANPSRAREDDPPHRGGPGGDRRRRLLARGWSRGPGAGRPGHGAATARPDDDEDALVRGPLLFIDPPPQPSPRRGRETPCELVRTPCPPHPARGASANRTDRG